MDKIPPSMMFVPDVTVRSITSRQVIAKTSTLSLLSAIPFKPQMSLKLLKNSATAGKLELFIDFANPDISEYKQL